MSGASFKIPPPPEKQQRITFAWAILEAHDTDKHPHVYALQWAAGGHALDAAHCVEACPSPGDCDCAEITHLSWQAITDTYLLAREHGALCHLDLEDFCADDANMLLQVAIWGSIQFK